MSMIKTAGLGLHFLLELGILAALGVWGFRTGQSWPARALLGIGLPLLGAIAWGVFRVPNDPGPAVVAIPGAVRLALELGLFALAGAALASIGRPQLAIALGLLVLVDYLLMYERVIRLLGRN